MTTHEKTIPVLDRSYDESSNDTDTLIRLLAADQYGYSRRDISGLFN